MLHTLSLVLTYAAIWTFKRTLVSPAFLRSDKLRGKTGLLMALVLFTGLVACEKTPIDPTPTLPPQQHLPNPLPEHALLDQLRWSANDFQTFSYNYRGQVSQMRSQWQYVQGDPSAIRSIVYDWVYDSQDRPVQKKTSGGFTINYFYNGDRLDKTQELYPGGALAIEVQYLYGSGRVVQERWRVSNEPGAPETVYKYVFSYDTHGNLAKVETYEQDENGQFEWRETTEYSEFDDKLNPTSWMLRYPYLPQFQYQYNNPKKEVRHTAAAQMETTTHVYTYSEKGLPTSKRTTSHTGQVVEVAYLY